MLFKSEIEKAEIIKPKAGSSINFGHEKPVYCSAAHEGMTYHGTKNEYSKMKNEVVALKTHLRKHNFTLGTEVTQKFNIKLFSLS